MIENIHQRPILISNREGGIFSRKRSQGEYSPRPQRLPAIWWAGLCGALLNPVALLGAAPKDRDFRRLTLATPEASGHSSLATGSRLSNLRGAIRAPRGGQRNLRGAIGAFLGRGSGHRLGLPVVNHADQQEDRERHDQEVDDVVQKHSVVDGGGPRGFRLPPKRRMASPKY